MIRVRGFLPALLLLVLAAAALLRLFPAEPRPRSAPVATAGVPLAPAALRESIQPAKNPAATAPTAPTAHGRVHVSRAGEAVVSIARAYLPETPYMTTRELEAAIRRANPDIQGQFLRGGTPVVIPDVEPQPVVERPVARARDFEVRAIYLTGTMAGSETGLRLIQRWRDVGGNAIVFDVKDSDGAVNIPFAHPLAPAGRNRPIRNLPKFVRWAHQQGLHVIARIAIFRDESLMRRHPELGIVSRRTGAAWRENGKLAWVDPSRAEVQEYNLALAKVAAAGGVDEIQYDYVRFPAEGDQADTRFAYQDTEQKTRADVITEFVARSHDELRPLGVLFSLDVFGVVAWQRPIDLAHVGQDIPRLARACDVLSPMIYPSHFFGMDGHKLPGDAPEHFIAQSMARFGKITEGTGVVLRPWLQAFGWRTKTYSPQYIATQVAVAKKGGGIGFLFWNARNDYSKPFAAMSTMRQTPEKFFRERVATSAGME